MALIGAGAGTALGAAVTHSAPLALAVGATLGTVGAFEGWIKNDGDNSHTRSLTDPVTYLPMMLGGMAGAALGHGGLGGLPGAVLGAVTGAMVVDSAVSFTINGGLLD